MANIPLCPALSDVVHRLFQIDRITGCRRLDRLASGVARHWRSAEVGEVAERSNATDCKSVAQVASEVRILPSPPIFFVDRYEGGSNSVVESQPSKLLVAGSIPVSRSRFCGAVRERYQSVPM